MMVEEPTNGYKIEIDGKTPDNGDGFYSDEILQNNMSYTSVDSSSSLISSAQCNTKFSSHAKVEEPAKSFKMEFECKSVENGDGLYPGRISQNNTGFTSVKSSNDSSPKKSSPILEGLISGHDENVNQLTPSSNRVVKTQENGTLEDKKKEDILICFECGDQFNFIEELEEHLLVLHRDQKIYKCITCKAKFLDQTVLHAHLSNCSGKFLYLCFHCGEDFMYISQYESHVEIHSGENLFHDNTEPSFYTLCFQCGEEFTDNEEYSGHLEVHKKTKKTHHCDFCLQSFCSSNEYELHLSNCYQPPESYSSVNGTYECIDCGESFYHYTKYAEHQKLHEAVNFFVCKCGIKFSTNLALKNHVQAENDEENHTEIKPFLCQFCDKAFSHPGHYKRHLLSHNLRKKFPCEECGKVFDKQSYLDVHARLHSGDRPFVCECGKSFAAKKRLNRHKKIHVRDSLIKCAQCGKGFTELSRLKVHMKTHSGLRPFTCNVCNHSFTRSNHLKRHMTIHERAAKKSEMALMIM